MSRICISQIAYHRLRIAPKVGTAFNKCRLWGRETQPPTAQNYDTAKGEIIMAKRIVTTLIALALVFTALLPVGALSVVPMNDTPHEYSVLPGTDAWIEMSPEERRTATYVDQAEAENMTTRALLITTLGYPFLIDMYCIGYSSDCFLPGNTASALSNGIEIVAETFPPLKELLQRTDAVAEIDSLLEVIDEDTFRNGRMKALDLRQYIMSASAASPSYLVDPGGKPVKQLPQDDINMRKNPSEESSAEEPYIVKVYDANDCVDIHTAVNYKGGLYEAQARLKTHYLMSDGTWRIGESYAKGQWYDKPYKYRYILSSGEACDETAIVLSNRPDLTYFDGLRLIYGSDLNYKYSLEATVVAWHFGDKTVAWAEMQDQVPAHCVSLSHGEQ